MWNGLSRTTRIAAGMGLIILLALGLRIIGVAFVPPRWDEGWSVAIATLPLSELAAITSADVHPPLFYMLLGAWEHLVGVNLFASRYLAVLMSLPAVPLAYAAARAWGGRHFRRSTRLAFIAAALMAWLPLAVYYSGVIRMYALAPTFTLLATWAAMRLAEPFEDGRGRSRRWLLTTAFVMGATGAMLTLYHAVWALVALGLYALVVALFTRKGAFIARLWPLAIAVSAAVLFYLPWAIYAIPQLLNRASGGNIGQNYPVSYFIDIATYGLTMSQQVGAIGLALIGLIIGLGLVCSLGQRRRTSRRFGGLTAIDAFNLREDVVTLLRLGLPALVILFTIGGVAAAARNWAFNERMLICAAPGLVFLLAWSFDQMSHRSRILAAVMGLALVSLYFRTSSTLVVQKTLEVFDPYNPHTYIEHIQPRARPDDLAIFNVLSPAGFYALDRTAAAPGWSYALTWDPVIEDFDRWQARITQAAHDHARLWIVLYRGLAGKNGDLRGWLDSNLYPAGAEWGDEGVFYGLYGGQQEPMVAGGGWQTHWQDATGFDLELRSTQLPLRIHPSDIIPVALIWRAPAALKQNYKVFVHAFDLQGHLVAQHDALPLNDLRPMPSFKPGSDNIDHHGLALPGNYQGSLRIEVGIYDPATGVRVKTSSGLDSLVIGTVDVTYSK
jgi:4-amino-4-deoxy-L-arabinose transferase-like glycosyltransferase